MTEASFTAALAIVTERSELIAHLATLPPLVEDIPEGEEEPVFELPDGITFAPFPVSINTLDRQGTVDVPKVIALRTPFVDPVAILTDYRTAVEARIAVLNEELAALNCDMAAPVEP